MILIVKFGVINETQPGDKEVPKREESSFLKELIFLLKWHLFLVKYVFLNVINLRFYCLALLCLICQMILALKL